MRALTVALCTLIGAEYVSAQGMVAGYALDKATSTPLPCMDVALVRDDRTVIARTRTGKGGAFMFSAPPTGRYRIVVQWVWRA